ncbi:uncharacterized protein [Nicotiana sylvestris]|uniref:uncharacterized protein n=1 Tax=Nicotiana sylvestris TaxID=4096 RepID=UPI00388CCC46
MDISRIQAFAQHIERGRHRQQDTERTDSGQWKRMRFSRSQEQSQGSYRPQYFEWPPRPPPSQVQGYKYDSYTQLGPGESSQASSLQRQRDSGQTWPVPPQCAICGHMMRDCPNRDFGDMAQPANLATGSAMYVHLSGHESQSSAGRGRGRGRGSNSGGNQNRIYALAGRHDQESLPDVVTMPEILSNPFVVSTPVGESIIARCIYRGCTISVCGRRTSANLVELEMLDFDAIMGMDWLAACYATVDCQAKIARFHFPGEPVLEWVGNTATPRGRFISYLKARKMIAKGCIYHIVRVKDAAAEIPTLQSIPVVKEYTNVFLDELPSIPPEREIDFGIDLLSRTQPISIPSYRMTPAKLKKLKEQLKDLMEKGKANVVADALSRRFMGSLAHVEAEKRQLTKEIHQLACLGVRLVNSGNGGVVLQNTTKSSLIAEVKERQYEDPELVKLRERFPQQKKPLLELKGGGVLRYRARLCVPDVARLRDRIMSEAHYSWYSIHPGSTKMYHDIKDVYWWNDMKKNIVEYVAQCPSCQQVKIEH